MHIGARIIQRMWCQYPAEAKVPGTILKEEPTFAVLQSFKPQRITKVVWVVRQKKGNENNDHDISWWISWIVKGISLESLSPEWEYVLGFKVWFTTPCWELTNLPWGNPSVPFRTPHGLLSRHSTLPWSNELQRWIPKVFNRMDSTVSTIWDGVIHNVRTETCLYIGQKCVLFKLHWTSPCPVALSCFKFQDWPYHKLLQSVVAPSDLVFGTFWWLRLNHPTWIQKVLLGTLAAGQRHFWPQEIDFGKVFIYLYNSLQFLTYLTMSIQC